MLYKLSISNIKRSFKDYTIYFFTLILGVCIFYIFNSLDSQTAMLNVSSSTSEMIDLLLTLLQGVSVFVAFILGFLIIYASRFLIKKRNKEFAVYMTLGMPKRKISMLLLLETIIIGLVSLVIGLLLGILLSQVTSIFVANLFEVDMTKFEFNYSSSAAIKTMIYYGIIYVIVMIFNTISVNKCKLINLLHSNKKSEKVKVKNPILCIFLFIISIILLSSAYYMVTSGINKLLEYDVNILFLPISLGVLGTILFYFSISGMLIKILSKCKNLYYKGLNSFVFKQISSKINTMIASISIICIMLFITLCLLSSALTIKDYFNNSINKYAPVDFELIYWYDEDEISNEEMLNYINGDKFIKENTKDVTLINEYYDDNFSYKESLGDYFEEMRKKYPYIQYDSKVEIMRLSDYKKISKLLDLDNINLENDEYAIVSNYESNIYNGVMKKGRIVNIFSHNLHPFKDKTVDGFVSIGANPSNLGFFVVPDKVVDESSLNNKIIIGNYKKLDKEKINILEEKINNISKTTNSTSDTRLEIKEACVGLSAIVTFIGLYLGIIFLISSAAILSLKQLSDSIDDKDKYKVLRNIGTDEKDINKAIFKQALILFMMPLLLAIIHTIFGIKFCMFILSSMGITNLLKPTIITFIFLLVIYGLYFIITYFSSKNIIKERA